MKRFLVLILSLVYFATTTGATVYYHFCMDKMAGWSVWEKKEKTCGKCGMDKEENTDNGCCNDEHKWVKIEGDQNVSFLNFEIAAIEAVTQDFHYYDFSYSANTVELLPRSHAPPRSSDISVYLRNCNFRI